jgi:hypothetical protein
MPDTQSVWSQEDIREFDLGSINPGGVVNSVLNTEGYAIIWGWFTVFGTTTLTDGTVFANPYKGDLVTATGNGFTLRSASSWVSDGTNIHVLISIEVRGMKKIRIPIINNNAGAKNARAIFFLGTD